MIRTVADEPALLPNIEALITRGWPTYVIESHDARLDGMRVYWPAIYDLWPHFQFAMIDDSADDILACGNSLPLAWDGDVNELPDTGWTWAMCSGAEDRARGRPSHTLCALGITIQPELQGRGLSSQVVLSMLDLARDAGFNRLIAPVRPSHKSRYPLASFAEYLTWTTADVLPFDPWLRVHVRLGGRVIKPCNRSMGMTGSVADWERWSGLRFPVSGQYAVRDCLAPVDIDLALDRGIYIEPNVWVLHTVQGTDEQ